ncbi:unnamed protein product [Linum tenue]|uniref:Uncharacterized protein n=1 Tax=Linum tenue TaxID=586396 RepID=A0AAV0K4D0_9ROSI|nr:unnamed protein product [Linum tenue]
MRGVVWLDDEVETKEEDKGVLPPIKISGDTSKFVYKNKQGHRSAIRISRIVSETLRLGMEDVRWFVMGDDDTVFVTENLIRILRKMDSAGIMQQSICYDKSRSWTVSVSWGFAVQIFRGVFSPREIEMPSRTFLNWYRRADYTAYAFNTRPVARNPCQKPFVFYLSKARSLTSLNTTVSEYQRHRVPHPECKWKMADPSSINMAVVYKRPDPQLWSRVSV